MFEISEKYTIFARSNNIGSWSLLKSWPFVQPLAIKTFIVFFDFMYAIVEIAGQQFKVQAGQEIFVNRLAAEKDAVVEFNKVLLIDNEGAVKVGSPYVDGAMVKATVLDDTCKGKKVIVFKKKRRKGYQKKNGHRQYLSLIKIESIA